MPKSTHKGYEFWCDVDGLKTLKSDNGNITLFYLNEKSADSTSAYGQQMIEQGRKQDDKFFKFI